MRSRLLFPHSGRQRWLPLLAAVVAVLLWPRPAAADLGIAIQNVTAPAGSTGTTIEVDLTNSGATVSVGSFSFSFSVGNTKITFTSADNKTASPYIFAGHSAFSATVTPQSVSASDTFTTPNQGVNLGKGTVGLGRALFNVAPDASPGVFPVTLNSVNIADPNGNTLFVSSFANGSITITPNISAVPEPSTFALAGLLMGGGAFGYFRRKRALAKATATPAPAPAPAA